MQVNSSAVLSELPVLYTIDDLPPVLPHTQAKVTGGTPTHCSPPQPFTSVLNASQPSLSLRLDHLVGAMISVPQK